MNKFENRTEMGNIEKYFEVSYMHMKRWNRIDMWMVPNKDFHKY